MTSASHSHYEIRVATAADVAAVETLLRASYPPLMAASYDEESLAPALELMTRSNPSLLVSGTYYVAEPPTGPLAGCGGWTRERPGTGAIEPHLGHIRHFAVHPSWTRRGVGRAIYALCERTARAAGVTAFECYSSLNAESFYRALKFERMREMKLTLKAGVVLPAILMRREL